MKIITRQVDDIGRMVDEFSSFARMPQPEMERNSFLGLLMARSPYSLARGWRLRLKLMMLPMITRLFVMRGLFGKRSQTSYKIAKIVLESTVLRAPALK